MKPGDWLLLLAGIVALLLAVFMASGGALAQQAVACTRLEPLIARDRKAGQPFLVLDGWRGERLAKKHADWTGTGASGKAVPGTSSPPPAGICSRAELARPRPIDNGWEVGARSGRCHVQRSRYTDARPHPTGRQPLAACS